MARDKRLMLIDKKSSFGELEHPVLIIAAISAFFVFYWQTYCYVYYHIFSLPSYSWNIPQMLVLSGVVSFFVHFNIFISSIILILFLIFIKINNKTTLYTFLSFVVCIFISIFILFKLKDYNSELMGMNFSQIYHTLRDNVGLVFVKYIPDIWIFGAAIIIILSIIYWLIPRSEYRWRFKRTYLKTSQDKFMFFVLLISFIIIANYLFIVLTASVNSQSVAKGDIGFNVQLNKNESSILPENLSLILICDSNYYLFERNKSYDVTNNKNKPIQIYIVPTNKIVTLNEIADPTKTKFWLQDLKWLIFSKLQRLYIRLHVPPDNLQADYP